MPADLHELSSISSSLQQLTRRVAEMAEGLDRSGEEDAAASLFGVERALEGASRRLSRVIETGRLANPLR
ncbi:MAG: hypothetical protein ACRDZ5_08020 [Acidimicrobiales bacterium]